MDNNRTSLITRLSNKPTGKITDNKLQQINSDLKLHLDL